MIHALNLYSVSVGTGTSNPNIVSNHSAPQHPTFVPPTPSVRRRSASGKPFSSSKSSSSTPTLVQGSSCKSAPYAGIVSITTTARRDDPPCKICRLSGHGEACVTTDFENYFRCDACKALGERCSLSQSRAPMPTSRFGTCIATNYCTNLYRKLISK